MPSIQTHRGIQKLKLKLQRSQSLHESKVVVLGRSKQQLGIANEKNASMTLLTEKLRGSIAKLKVDVLGCPRVRVALAAADDASSRANNSQAELSKVEALLQDALANKILTEQKCQDEHEVTAN